jgi:hypothetical protein
MHYWGRGEAGGDPWQEEAGLWGVLGRLCLAPCCAPLSASWRHDVTCPTHRMDDTPEALLQGEPLSKPGT